MAAPIIRELYRYAADKYPAVAEHLAMLDMEIADRASSCIPVPTFDLIRTRLEILRRLHEGKGLESIINPGPRRTTTEELLLLPARPV